MVFRALSGRMIVNCGLIKDVEGRQCSLFIALIQSPEGTLQIHGKALCQQPVSGLTFMKN